jgi:hypothetical protein
MTRAKNPNTTKKIKIKTYQHSKEVLLVEEKYWSCKPKISQAF